MNLRELRVRASSWIALIVGAGWIFLALLSRRSKVAFADLYPGFALLAASALLFGLIKYLDRPPNFDRPDAADEAISREGMKEDD